MNKKYYLISEVSDFLQIPTHKIRYIEKKYHNININKTKQRRYYSRSDIENLSKLISKNLTQKAHNKTIYNQKTAINNENIISRTDQILTKFRMLLNFLDN